MKILFCLSLSLVALTGCKGTALGFAVKAPLFGEVQFRADPVREVAEGVTVVTDAVGITGKPEVK